MKSVILTEKDGSSPIILLVLGDDDVEALCFGEQLHMIHPDGGWPDILVANVEDSHELDTIFEDGSAGEIIQYLESKKPAHDYIMDERFRQYEPQPVNRMPSRVNVVEARRIEISVASDVEDGSEFLSVSMAVEGMDAEVSFRVSTPEKADRLIATLVQMRHNMWPG